VWHPYGDKISRDEGPSMQQVPKHEQQLSLRLCATMGDARTRPTTTAA